MLLSDELKSYIRDVADFPKSGIVFKDITTLLKNPQALQKASDALFELIQHEKIDKVVGIESRGFFFGAMLASRLQAGFVPVRKPKKLPSKVFSETYALEYGTDTIEIHQDAIQAGDRVLVHDDVIATGGTAQAACALVEKAGGTIVQVSFLIELGFLNGRELLKGQNVQSVIRY